ncbi:hypothetical protein H0H92_012689 [Tricholoma furcatifolium]|nr:hypothetical protein H0H92_012689 [Tricholoma furcatifolium]
MTEYVMTLDSDSEEPLLPATLKTSKLDEDASLNPEFVFDISGDPYEEFVGTSTSYGDLVKGVSKPDPISVDDIIARRTLNRKRKLESRDEDDESDDDEEDASDEDFLDSDSEQSGAGTNVSDEEEGDEYSSSDSESETQAERDRKAAFFDSDIGPSETHSSFLTMNISRPILKALTALGFDKPTPIQAATIPMALLGKDIVGNAVTGSGKTAAFMIPILERLLYREKGKNAAATRCVILVPTRELAVQCFDVGTKLAVHTDVRLCLVVGGLSVKSQEVALRSRPDIVIATPGRLIDHIRNSPSFTLETLDVLILDEADRMLSDGFADELAEIIKSCPLSRQTMLFSATMTDSVDELVKMSLNKPVRLFVDPKRSTARGLIQEFVRVRATKESERSALLVALCKRTFKSNRLKALQLFRDGSVDYLMATDLASRGLDIKGVETVINYDMPGQLAQYLHRVGRTARAGKKGRSVTLVGEGDRKMLKATIKHGAGEDQVRHRIIPPEVVVKWTESVQGLKDEIAAVLRDEVEEKQASDLRKAEMELKKGENMIEYESEIYSRPARTWFQSVKEKENAQAVSKQQYEDGFASAKAQGKMASGDKPKRDKYSGLSRRAKRRKMIMEEEAKFGDEQNGINAAIRAAKKSARPAKIGVPEQRTTKTKAKPKTRKVTSKAGGAFDRDFEGKAGRREGVRAKKGDAIGKKSGHKGSSRKNHTYKVWEVDAGVDGESSTTEITGIAWSPDGQTIAAVHRRSIVTLHSLQDGARLLTLSLSQLPGPQFSNTVAVWWFRDERPVRATSVPDILRRSNIVKSNRFSPTLDYRATDLFSFQGAQTKTTKASPSIIDGWPSLPPDPLAASVSTPTSAKHVDLISGPTNEMDDSNFNRSIILGSNVNTKSLLKAQMRPVFHAHISALVQETVVTTLRPTVIETPLLAKRHVRDMAKLSTTAKELMRYCMHAVKDSHATWFGSESFSGARTLGPNWIQTLEAKQKEQFGQHEPNAILDLTTLLVAGRASDSLLDFLGSGDLMSERSIQKWESTMTEALIKLRDYSEKRIAPACQRLHLVLAEIQGWAQLSEFAHFELVLEEINGCLSLTNQMIVLAAWLAATARRDLSRFRNFLQWLRFEIGSINPTGDNAPQPRHDILEVNNYLMTGLSTSTIDQWFTGTKPHFSLPELGMKNGNFSDVLNRAYSIVKNDTLWTSVPAEQNYEDLNRNLNILVDELATRCRQIFDRAACGATRSATRRVNAGSAANLASQIRLMNCLTPSAVRERTTKMTEPVPAEQYDHLRFRYNEATGSPSEVGLALLEPFIFVDDEGISSGLDLIEVDFLDSEYLVMVYQLHGNDSTTHIAMMNYSDLSFQTTEVRHLEAREEVMFQVIEQWKQGRLSAIRVQVERTSTLTGGKGSLSLALNGKQGRRVACVVDSKGTLEAFDLEGDDEGT